MSQGMSIFSLRTHTPPPPSSAQKHFLAYQQEVCNQYSNCLLVLLYFAESYPKLPKTAIPILEPQIGHVNVSEKNFKKETVYCIYMVDFLTVTGGSVQTIAQQEVELFLMVVYGRIFRVEEDENNPLTP